MKFEKTSDEKLLELTKQKAVQEKMMTLDILHHLREIERRQLFLNLGFPSLFEYCVEELGYSEGAASRRISSMRLIADVSKAEEKLKNGSVNMSTLSQLQKFIRKEERYQGRKMDLQEKEELLARIANKSQQEVEREFAIISPHIALSTERHRAITRDLTEVRIVIDTELVKKLEKVRSLLSHRKPYASFVDLVNLMADMTLKKLEPKKPNESSVVPSKSRHQGPSKALVASPAPLTSAAKVKNERYIPSEIRSVVWHRDRGKCTFVSSENGHPCNSDQQVQFDHIIPIQGGGKSEPSNLRLLCALHNRAKGNHLET